MVLAEAKALLTSAEGCSVITEGPSVVVESASVVLERPSAKQKTTYLLQRYLFFFENALNCRQIILFLQSQRA